MKRVVLCTVAVLIVIFATSCTKATSPSGVSSGLDEIVSRDDATGPNHLSKTDPHVYFPMDVGTTWTYEISLGKADPLNYGVTSWPQGDDYAISYVTRGRYRGAMDYDGNKPLRLSIKVEGVAPKQGPLQFPESVKLAVLEDDLGIYDDSEEVFWAGTSADGLMVEEVITRSPDTPGAPGGAWGSYGVEPGWSKRLVFFARRPGIGISEGEDSPDTLIFVGPKGNQLHFLREVEVETKEPGTEGVSSSVLEKPFKEYIIFEKGKGLVNLIQEVDGIHSMSWELVKFTPGIS